MILRRFNFLSILREQCPLGELLPQPGQFLIDHQNHLLIIFGQNSSHVDDSGRLCHAPP